MHEPLPQGVYRPNRRRSVLPVMDCVGVTCAARIEARQRARSGSAVPLVPIREGGPDDEEGT